jgi:localization factor PodJL
MKLGIPWRAKGIGPDARETAREAARRAGMSMGEWLNTVILDSADEERTRLSRRGYDNGENDSDQLFAVHERLDELSRRLEHLQRAPARHPSFAPPRPGLEAYAPPSYAQNRDHELAEAIARLDRRMDELVNASHIVAAPVYTPAAYAPPPGMPEPSEAAPADAWTPDIDQAMAEISARMQTLDADPNAPAVPPEEPATMPEAPAQAEPAPVSSEDLAGLEQHLRHITSEIEALRQQQPQQEEGIAALRESLSDVARTLLDAMPKRAIEALEAEVRALAERLLDSRQGGADGNTLAAVERGLAEVLDTLRTLRPAENLDGYREAVHGLAQKIDRLGASAPDANAFQQLESAVATMQGFVSDVASNEALAHLAAEVHALAAKVDQVAAAATGGIGHGNALEILDQRVAHIAEALESRVQNGGSVTPQLEALIERLSDKIERLQLSRGDDVAFGNLEDRIARLVEKLDASGARFSQLEAIERGLADLLVHIENGGAAAAAAAPQVDGLQRDLVRTQTSLEAVHGTLGDLVDRLALLESDVRETRAQPQEPQEPPTPMPQAAQLAMPEHAEPPIFAPAPTPTEASPPPDRAIAHAQAAAAMARANPKAMRAPIDPNLPPDHPLEPGLNPRARLTASPADRIAASEAALGPVSSAFAAGDNKSNFIAAARRAAKAAAAEPTTADLRAAAAQRGPGDKDGNTFAQRMRSLFAGASVILIAGGAIHIALNLIDSADISSNNEIASTAAPNQPEVMPPADEPQPAATALPSAPSLEIPSSPEMTGSVAASAPPPPSPSYTLPSSLALPTLPATQPAPDGEKLPPAIGGAVLREAAEAGDAAAEYEIGLRYAEGRGVTVNASEAARWLELAAKQGLAMAQFRLAGFYEKGVGLKKDIETARRLYKAAAEQGNAKAMHNLAVLYAEGAAVKPDYRTAAQWFRLAADHGVADSQYNLAVLYARGIGVDRNLVESYKWFALAADQGDQEAAKKRDDVAKRLDPPALATAKLVVRTFVPQPQPEAATAVKLPAGWDAAASNPTDAAPAKAKRSTAVRVGSR